MTQVFEIGSGRFMPLTGEQLGQLSELQRAAYTELKDAVGVLARVDADAAGAKAQLTADVAVLNEAERTAPKPPTFHDLWKQTFGS